MGEAAAFVLMTRSDATNGWQMGLSFEPESNPEGILPNGVDVGAASGVLQWALAFKQSGTIEALTIRDESGLGAWIHPA